MLWSFFLRGTNEQRSPFAKTEVFQTRQLRLRQPTRGFFAASTVQLPKFGIKPFLLGEWGNGIIITSDCGSFPHYLLSTSKP
jgi:hypothetical protein